MVLELNIGHQSINKLVIFRNKIKTTKASIVKQPYICVSNNEVCGLNHYTLL